jgi:hypothetical protein
MWAERSGCLKACSTADYYSAVHLDTKMVGCLVVHLDTKMVDHLVLLMEKKKADHSDVRTDPWTADWSVGLTVYMTDDHLVVPMEPKMALWMG